MAAPRADGWDEPTRGSQKELKTDTTRFKAGISKLSEYAHSRGGVLEVQLLEVYSACSWAGRQARIKEMPAWVAH